ncbi:hypothetical protein [Meiothermus sp.]|uniref:hypothetical protein n=1 Tax=Meiothermus sp. TaxID=1955249 RepID=UPI002614C250|nr:hypothetical protein [Meiothermus sp.]
MGEYTYGKRTRKPQPELVPVPVPPLVEPALFEACPGAASPQRPVRRCATPAACICSRDSSAADLRARLCRISRLLRLRGASQPSGVSHPRHALYRSARAPGELEESIWQDIRSFLLNPGEALQAFLNEESPESNEVSLLERRLQALLEARARLLDLYLEGGVEKETYYARLEDLDSPRPRSPGELGGSRGSAPSPSVSARKPSTPWRVSRPDCATG